jgi:hypothetical protein
MRKRISFRPRQVVFLTLVLASVPVLAAFTERYYFEVPREGETALRADLDLALGRVTVGKAESDYLFQAEIALEDQGMVPEMSYERDGRTGDLTLSFDSGGKSEDGLTVRGFNIPEDNEWLLFFSDRVALDLSFELGMTEADLDLTGLKVERLSIESGMAKTTLAFDERNPVTMEHLDVDAGMTKFVGRKLGNARFKRFTLEGGAGSFDLDFTGGPLPAGAEAEIEVGVSSVMVRLPDNAPVILYAPDSWLARVEVPNGFVKRGKGLWHSQQVGREEDAFIVRIESGMGKVAVNVE